MTTITTLPLRTSITAGESLDSWIDALARRNDTSPREVLRASGIDHPGQSIRQLVDELDPTQLRRIEAATGLPPHRLDAATGPAVPGIERLSRNGSRFCPRCLAETDGRWQLSWRSSWAMVCGRHRCCCTTPAQDRTAEQHPECRSSAAPPHHRRQSAAVPSAEPGSVAASSYSPRRTYPPPTKSSMPSPGSIN